MHGRGSRRSYQGVGEADRAEMLGLGVCSRVRRCDHRSQENVKKVHMGRLFDFVVDKHSELAHLGQSKFKGRAVSKETTLTTKPV